MLVSFPAFRLLEDVFLCWGNALLTAADVAALLKGYESDKVTEKRKSILLLTIRQADKSSISLPHLCSDWVLLISSQRKS